MPQRPRSEVEDEIISLPNSNFAYRRKSRMPIEVELLLDLRDTANEILKEMKDKDRSCDLAVNNGTGEVSYHDYNVENSGSCYFCKDKEKRERLVRK